jgi:hypothetical protein
MQGLYIYSIYLKQTMFLGYIFAAVLYLQFVLQYM